MHFNRHYRLEGTHAFLSPSQYAWIRYDDEKLQSRFLKAEAARRGTELHNHAKESIRLGVKLAGKTTLSMFVNDAIGYRMIPEQVVYYSDNCYGSVDAISFRRNKLRIFDLKTGETPTSVDQLLIYDALFCLEYGFKPFEIEHDLRIYQSNEIIKFDTDPGDVFRIMDVIVHHDKRISEMREEAELS